MINMLEHCKNLSIKKKMTALFLVIGVIPLLVITYLFYYISEQTLMSSMYETDRVLADGIAREVSETLTARTHIIKTAAGSEEILSGNQVRQIAAVKNIKKQNPGFIAVALINAEGMQIANSEGSASNLNDREYFKQVKNGAEVAFSDVMKTKEAGISAVMCAVPVKDSENKFIGAVVGLIDLQVLNQQAATRKIGDTGFVFIVDRAGKILSHPDMSLIYTEAPAVPSVKAALSGQTGVALYEMQSGKKIAGYSSIPATGWAVIVQQNFDEAIVGASKVKRLGVIFTLGGAILAMLLGVLAAGVLIRPIRELAMVTDQLAQGNLAVKARVTTKDETGQLATSFNTMAESLRGLIRSVIGTADQLAAASEELAATSGEAKHAIHQIVGTINDFAQGSQQQTQEVDKTLHIMKNLNQVSKEIAQKAQLAVTLSGEMSAAAEDGGAATNNAVGKIGEIQEHAEATSAVVTALGEKSNQIGDILNVISEIAGQTNLLALNAAIEAARAGEQGRGFAVVAEEVRKLAEQSQAAARQIAQIVQDIQAQTAEVINSMRVDNAKVNEGVIVVNRAGQALENILGKIGNSASMISDINGAAAKQMHDMAKMEENTANVAVIACRTSDGAQASAAASQEITASMEEFANASQSLADLAGELQTMIARFKI